MLREDSVFLPRVRNLAFDHSGFVGIFFAIAAYVCYTSYGVVAFAVPMMVHILALIEAGRWYFDEYRRNRIDRAVEHTPPGEDLEVRSLYRVMDDSNDASTGICLVMLSAAAYLGSALVAPSGPLSDPTLTEQIVAEADPFMTASLGAAIFIGGVELVMRGVDEEVADE